MTHDTITQALSELLTQLELPFSDMTVDDSDEQIIRVDIVSDQASRLIGWHGETINAIQHLLKSILRTQEKLKRAPFIVLDVDGYRRAQEEKVCRIAEQKADFVRRKQTRVALPPMSPYFRRIVHVHVAADPEMQDLTTESVGEGDYRQIILRLKEEVQHDDDELAPVIDNADEEMTPITEENDSVFDDLDV